MNRKIKLLITIFLAVVFQISFFPGLTAGTIIPDIVLVLIILWSSRKKFGDIWLWVIFSGLLLDLASFEKLGTNIISLVIISFGASFLQTRFFIAQKLSSFLIVLGIVIGGTFFNFLIINFLTGSYWDFSWSWLGMKMVGNVVVSIFLYIVMSKFKEFFGIKESGLKMN